MMKKSLALFTATTACMTYIIHKRQIPSSIRILELQSYEIVVLNRSENVETRLRRSILEDNATTIVLGIDTEWLNERKVALLQIATHDKVFLIRMNVCYPDNRVPENSALARILREPRYVKTGVNVKYDLHLLETQFSISETKGFVDLQVMAMCMNLDKKGHRGYGLRALTRIVLNRELPKNREIRCGDWSDLSTKDKIEYAARDAVAGYRIPIHLWKESSQSSLSVFEYLSPYIDKTRFRSRRRKRQPQRRGTTNNKDKSAFQTLKTPKYQGCKLLSKDGVHLCNINEKKVRWYLKKNLAVLVEEKNMYGDKTIQLTFEAKGRGHAGDEFYLSQMNNRCVGCGSTSNGLISHSVIPRAFRKHFPEKYKSHSNHDIVLLCRVCKKQLSDASCRKKDDILAVLKEEHESKFREHRDSTDERYISQTLKVCNALLKHELPEEVKRRYETLVCRYLDIESSSLSKSDIQALRQKLQIHVKERDRLKPDVASIYVKTFLSDPSSIQSFVFMWRNFFVDTLKPRFLVRGWSVDRPLSGDERD